MLLNRFKTEGKSRVICTTVCLREAAHRQYLCDKCFQCSKIGTMFFTTPSSRTDRTDVAAQYQVRSTRGDLRPGTLALFESDAGFYRFDVSTAAATATVMPGLRLTRHWITTYK